MPVPHLEIRIVQRSKGSSAVAGAAYQAGEKLFSEYDQKMKTTFTRKRWFTQRSCCPPMPHPDMLTEQHFGTLPRK